MPRCIGFVRPSRRARCALLRMRYMLDGIKKDPHPEEPAPSRRRLRRLLRMRLASRRTHRQVSMPEPEDSAAPLREAWYYAAAGRQLRRGRVLARVMLGEPVLIGRDRDGAVFALRDICPHRGMPLSAGHFDGREIECCYHGWRFDTRGRCTLIPSLVPGQSFTPGQIRTRLYPAREVQGNIWVFFGEDPAAAPDIPVLEGFDGRAPDLVESVRFAAAIDHAVIGLMDPAHGPFVHRAWWWRSRRSIQEKAKAFAPSPFGFTMTRHAPSRNSRAYRLLGGAPETEIVFRLPSI